VSYPEYEQRADRAPIGTDIERVQKTIHEYDTLLDLLTQKLENILRPAVPSAVPRDDCPRIAEVSPLRTEIQVLGNRMITLNGRFSDLVARIDT